MAIAQLGHQVLSWLAVLSAAAVLVLAGAAALQEPSGSPAVTDVKVARAQLQKADGQRADRHDNAVKRVEFAGFATAGFGLLMVLAAVAGGAPQGFVTISEAVLALAVLELVLLELGTGLYVVLAAATLAAAVRAAARHTLLQASWGSPVARDAAVPA